MAKRKNLIKILVLNLSWLPVIVAWGRRREVSRSLWSSAVSVGKWVSGLGLGCFGWFSITHIVVARGCSTERGLALCPLGSPEVVAQWGGEHCTLWAEDGKFWLYFIISKMVYKCVINLLFLYGNMLCSCLLAITTISKEPGKASPNQLIPTVIITISNNYDKYG